MLGTPRPNGPARSPLETYLREINQTPLLTAEEERELAHRIGAGDYAARDRMVRANLRLVVNIARGYQGKGLGLEDLIAEGNLGLVRAVEAFDPAHETRFSTYASFWIKQSIKRTLVNTAKTIRLPAYMVELLAKWRRATAALQEELGRTPTSEEIAQRLRISRKKLHVITKALRLASAAPQAEQAEEGWSIDEMLMDGGARAPDAELVQAEELRQIMALLGSLDERAAKVLRLRFGLDEEGPLTLSEIGTRLGLTRERVRQIVKEALGRLGEAM
jgi:RNA polymerase primary sigma factor